MKRETRKKREAAPFNGEINGEMLLYKTDDGRIRIETRMQDETIWLTTSEASPQTDEA